MSFISLQNVKKSYTVEGKSIPVLENLNLDIPKEKITVILGRSGCGKTTLLRIAGGLEMADQGQIIQSDSRKMNDKAAFVFQEPRLMPWLNVWENVELGLGSKQMEKNRKQEHGVLKEQIERVGLAGFEKAYPHQLSGGMQQRVSIARAFAYEPSMILMDEPFAALDYFTRSQMQKELLRLQKESCVSILFVTHSVDEALLLGHKIVVIERGNFQLEVEIDTENEERNLLDTNLIIQKKKIIEHLDL